MAKVKKVPLKSKWIFYTSLFLRKPSNNQGWGQQIAGVIQAATHKDSQAWQGMGISAEKLSVWCFAQYYLSSSKIPLEGTPYIFLLPTSQKLSNKSVVGKEECAGVLKKKSRHQEKTQTQQVVSFLGAWITSGLLVGTWKPSKNQYAQQNEEKLISLLRCLAVIFQHLEVPMPFRCRGAKKPGNVARTAQGTGQDFAWHNGVFHPNWPGFLDLPAKLWTTRTCNL